VQTLTDEEAPSEVPRDVVATALSSSSLNLTWKPPHPEAQNGVLQGYIVGYRVENSSDAFAYKTIKSDGKKDETIVLRDLRKYTAYAVVLQAYNAMGSGPKFDLTGQRTQEDGKLTFNRQTKKQTDTQTHRHTDRQTDRQADKQTNRQTDR